MGKINVGRVIIAGLIAGLIFNILEYILNGVIFAGDWETLVQQYGMEVPGGTYMAWVIIWGFIAGIFMVWLYAGIRPRFGPGAKTAIIAGFIVWFFWALFRLGDAAAMGMINPNMFWIMLIWTLIEIPLVTLVGAAIYKEES